MSLTDVVAFIVGCVAGEAILFVVLIWLLFKLLTWLDASDSPTKSQK